MESYPVDGNLIGVDVGSFKHRVLLNGKVVSLRTAWAGETEHFIQADAGNGEQIHYQVNILPKWHYLSTRSEIRRNGIVIFSSGGDIEKKGAESSSVWESVAIILFVVILFASVPDRFSHAQAIESKFARNHPIASAFGGGFLASSFAEYENYWIVSTTSYEGKLVGIGTLWFVWVIPE